MSGEEISPQISQISADLERLNHRSTRIDTDGTVAAAGWFSHAEPRRRGAGAESAKGIGNVGGEFNHE